MPTLEYACTVWDPYYSTSADNLEAVQRRAARWVMNNYDRECSVTCMLKKLDWRVLAQRRADARIKLLSKILKEEVDIEASKYVKHQRNNIDLVTIFANCNYYEHSFFPRTIRDWNNMPKDAKESNHEHLKKRVVDLIHDMPY